MRKDIWVASKYSVKIWKHNDDCGTTGKVIKMPVQTCEVQLSVTILNFKWSFYCKVCLSCRAPKRGGFSHPVHQNPINFHLSFLQIWIKFYTTCSRSYSAPFQMELHNSVHNLHVLIERWATCKHLERTGTLNNPLWCRALCKCPDVHSKLKKHK